VSHLISCSRVVLQTSGQTELENWITAIHSACAGALARHHRRDDTLRLLRSEVRKLEQKIDMDEKMKKMGDMQLSTVTDGKKRKTILEQVTGTWTRTTPHAPHVPPTPLTAPCWVSQKVVTGVAGVKETDTWYQHT